jgi:hypothetical protein
MAMPLFRSPCELLRLPHGYRSRKAKPIRFFAATVFTLTVWMAGKVAVGHTSDQFNETSLNTSLSMVKAPAGGTAALNNGELVITVRGWSNHQASSAGLNLDASDAAGEQR